MKDYVHDANILGSMAFMKTGSYALYDAYGGKFSHKFMFNLRKFVFLSIVFILFHK